MAKNNLTREEAQARTRLIHGISYDVLLDVANGNETFGSETVVRFRCKERGTATFLDLTAPRVASAHLNGIPLPPDAFDGNRLQLDGLAEENELRVVAAGAYQRTGSGLHRFEDPADGAVYLHTHFEPFDAHRVYPCFDQPDMKATFRLAVVAPSDWEVISNAAPATSPARDGEGRRRWSFRTTPRIPTYITAVAAGPFHVVRDRRGDVDLAVACRRSLARHLDADEIFDVTKRGLDFFERAFGYPYAFGKYDQVFVPESGVGAMENAGCVTIGEKHVFRSKVTDAARERRAETLLHEMAHMWFGNLVTMRWWDDLWLNESFASFAAVLAQVAVTRFSEGWTTFANAEKTWAYRQDQLPSTHPIVADVPDTESVRLMFDGITYAKGASVLRQLVAWVGEERFLEGMKAYFRRHEFGNADLDDFLAVLEDISGRDLRAWSKEWLETSGVDTLRPSFRTRQGDGEEAFTAFSLLQEAPPDHPTLRSHRVAIGLYDATNEGMVRRGRVEIDAMGKRTAVSELFGELVPDLVLVNDGDLTYAKIRFDDRSMRNLVEHLGDISDSLARTLCWGGCWDMTRDSEMAAREYLRLVLRHLHAESEIGVLQRLLGQAALAVQRYGDPSNRDSALRSLAGGSYAALLSSDPGSDRQLVFARSFISAARDEEDLEVVRGLLDGTRAFEGLTVDTELRWHIVNALAAAGAADSRLIDQELDRDPTDAGARHAAAARAARPLPDAKAEAWGSIVDDDKQALATLEAIMAGFQQAGQEELLEPYAWRYFEVLPAMWESREQLVSLAFAEAMYPHVLPRADVIEMSDRFLASDSVPWAIRRLVIEGRDGVLRAMRARAKDMSVGAGEPPPSALRAARPSGGR